VVVADAVEERAEALVRLKVDSVRNLLWTPLLRRATRRELTSRLGIRLAADTELSAGGRRRQRSRFVPSRGM
jgi:hypothetical protein